MRSHLKFFVICIALLTLSGGFGVFIINKTGLVDFSVTNASEDYTIMAKFNDVVVEVNPSKYISDGLVDSSLLLNDMGIQTSDLDSVKIDTSSMLVNCDKKQYQLNIDEENLTKAMLKKTDFDGFVTVDIEEYFLDSSHQLYTACQKYESDLYEISLALEQTLGLDKFSIKNIFGLYKANESYSWKISNPVVLRENLEKLSMAYEVEPDPGRFEEFDEFIAVYTKHSVGEKLNVEDTIQYISIWINNRNVTFEPIIQTVDKITFETTKPVYDFSNKVGTGQTRIDLIREGQGNSAVYFAELGLEEIQKVVIMPDEEFSYIDEIAKQPGVNRTAEGRLIGDGYCNSTTTIFRAVLETGLPITDRSSHGKNIASYDWGYPINAVDSTFFAVEGSEIDLKFINDFDYPIMLVYEKAPDENNFQYHYVHVLTDSRAKKRSVELYDWKKWGVYSPTHFQAEFRRRVFDGDILKFEDSFTSHYVD